MDEAAADSLLEELSTMVDGELARSDDRSWILVIRETPVLVELEAEGQRLRVTGEIGIEPSRVEDLLADPTLSVGMLRFNGDRTNGDLWIGLNASDPALVLTQQIPADQLTAIEIDQHLERFVSFYDAWFDLAEETLTGTPSEPDASPSTEQPPSPPLPGMKV